MVPADVVTDTGRQRDYNEDEVLTETLGQTTVLAVADGMGGHTAGDVASQLAVETLADALIGTRKSLPPIEECQSILASAVSEANEAVYNRSQKVGQGTMGTTLVTALVDGPETLIANIGDSRAYEIRADSIKQVTLDQSLVQQLVEQGELTEEEAATHPQRNVVSQALGTDETVDPDFYSRRSNGSLLLCSDGLTEEVDEATIHETVINATTPSEATDELVQCANENGGSDNISVVLHVPASCD